MMIIIILTLQDNNNNNNSNNSTRYDGSGIIRLKASTWKLRGMKKGFKTRW